MRKLETQKLKGARGGGGGSDGMAGAGPSDPDVKEAKKSELTTWLAAEIEVRTCIGVFRFEDDMRKQFNSYNLLLKCVFDVVCFVRPYEIDVNRNQRITCNALLSLSYDDRSIHRLLPDRAAKNIAVSKGFEDTLTL